MTDTCSICGATIHLKEWVDDPTCAACRRAGRQERLDEERHADLRAAQERAAAEERARHQEQQRRDRDREWKQDEERERKRRDELWQSRECPICRERIKLRARKCKHCDEETTDPDLIAYRDAVAAAAEVLDDLGDVGEDYFCPAPHPHLFEEIHSAAIERVASDGGLGLPAAVDAWKEKVLERHRNEASAERLLAEARKKAEEEREREEASADGAARYEALSEEITTDLMRGFEEANAKNSSPPPAKRNSGSWWVPIGLLVFIVLVLTLDMSDMQMLADLIVKLTGRDAATE